MTDLELEVQDGDITIALPGTSYTVTYYKPKKSPQLLAKRIASKDDPSVAMTDLRVPCSGLAARQPQGA